MKREREVGVRVEVEAQVEGREGEEKGNDLKDTLTAQGLFVSVLT